TGPREIPENENVRQEVGPATAVFLRDADAHQPQLGELAEELPRETVVAIPLGGVRIDLLGAELARERLDLALLRVQLEVQPEAPGVADEMCASTAVILVGCLAAPACARTAHRRRRRRLRVDPTVAGKRRPRLEPGAQLGRQRGCREALRARRGGRTGGHDGKTRDAGAGRRLERGPPLLGSAGLDQD